MEILIETFRSLIANKTRTFLSMLGIIIGVMAMIAVVSIGEGSTRSITDQVSSLGSNVIMISPGFSGGSGGRSATALSEILNIHDAENIQDFCPDVRAVTPLLQGSYAVSNNGNNTSATIFAGNDSLMGILDLQLESGRYLSEEDENEYAKNAIIGYSIAESIFEDENPIGKSIMVTYNVGQKRVAIPFKIVGLLKQTGSKLMYNPDRMIIIPFSTAQARIFHNYGKISTILVSARNSDVSAAAKSQIQHLLYNKFEDENMFNITSQDEILGTLSGITSVLNLFLGAIAGISLLVGGIGIMNIMLVSVSERTREIGIKKAIGATRKRILLEFLVESILITLVAGAIGIIFGIGVSKIVEQIGKQYNLVPVVSWQSILIAFGFATMIGLFFGIYPASKASKLSPVEALRYE